MKRIFISDLHLESPNTPSFQRFVECLNLEAQRVDEIYILGDLVEMWIGDDDDSSGAVALVDTLHAAHQLCSVFLMHGNRDFLFGAQFSQATGVTLLADPHQTDDGLVLSHGDALCTDDEEYQKLRTMLRSSAWQQDILRKSLDERKAFGQMLREQSKSANANKATNIMDVNAEATTQLMNSHRATTLIHGHTHRPGHHQHGEFNRWVTGAWEHCGWLLRQQDKSLQLECFSLARRYGT